MAFRLSLKRPVPVVPVLDIPRGAVTGLMFCLFLIIAWHTWHIPEIPVWVFLVVIPMGVFSYRRILRESPMPRRLVRLGLTALAVLGIYAAYGSPLGRDPGIASLILLSSLKLMEFKSRRDFMFVVFMCYFLVFGNFLYDQSLPDLAFMVLAFILVTAAILRLNHPDGEKVKLSSLLRFSFRLLLYMLPFTVFLFLLFPRTYGPLWNLPQDGNAGKTGFSSFVRPGDVASLAQSRATAFKVEFPGNDMPEQKDLYFRGLALWFTNGKGWYQGYIPSRVMRPRQSDREGIRQLITLVPHNRTWLFSLDRPISGPPRWVRFYSGGIYQTIWDVKTPYSYTVVSRLDAAYTFMPKVERRWGLQLPEKLSPRVRELGEQWRDTADGPEGIMRMAEEFFRTGGFSYTLSPGTLDPEDPLGQFLFESRQGFCEHFASSYGLLMRAAGVPTRLIAGYHGGEVNPVGEYLEVRQSDAHVWVEVWLEDGGWVRVDPTGWVAPGRIRYGAAVNQRLTDMGLSGSDQSEDLENALRESTFEKITKFLKQHWDNIKYKWDAWIISYDIFRQRNFLSELGFGRVDRMTLLMVVVISVPVLLFVLSLILKRRERISDPLLRIYRRYCVRLARAGVRRHSWEGADDYRRRAVTELPQKAQLIGDFTDLFIRLRYGRSGVNPEGLKQLGRWLRKL